MDATTLLTRLAETIDTHDWAGLADLLHADFTCRLVHTGEVFAKEEWVRFNAEYPGFERMRLDDLVTEGDRAVLRATVTSRGDAGEELVFAVASFATVRDGLIDELVEVWADVDQQPPAGTRSD